MTAQERLNLRDVVGQVAEFEGVSWDEVASRPWDVFQASLQPLIEQNERELRESARETLILTRVRALYEDRQVPRHLTMGGAVKQGHVDIADIKAASVVSEDDLERWRGRGTP